MIALERHSQTTNLRGRNVNDIVNEAVISLTFWKRKKFEAKISLAKPHYYITFSSESAGLLPHNDHLIS
jgi:hypothetical protein